MNRRNRLARLSRNGTLARPRTAFLAATVVTLLGMLAAILPSSWGLVISASAAPATTTITTSATTARFLGGTIVDTATLTAVGVVPTGTVLFQAFGPNNSTCAGSPAFASSVPVTGTATSGPFIPTVGGSYFWTAAFTPTTSTATSAVSACGASGEISVVGASPAFTTRASSPVVLGGSIFDTATLSGGVNPTGSITFTAFGPNNTSCVGTAAFTSNVTVNGNGTYTSGNFVPTTAGTYLFVATYNGDANNPPITSACGAANESTSAGVMAALTTTPSGSVQAGGAISDMATLTGVTFPTGTITFSLFGPGNTTCSGTPIFTSVKAVNGSGGYTSDSFATSATSPGTYFWQVAYSGDNNGNPPLTTACGTETVVVTSVPTIPVVPVVTPPPAPSLGYWLVAGDGGIFNYGSARFFGSTGGIRLNQPMVGMAATPSGNGYWLVASDGGIFPFGDAVGYGGTASIHLNQPIVGMAATPSGNGYWLVASDGGIFPFGDAVGYGSTGAIRLNKPVVGMSATPSGHGYWLVASDGGIFPFGDAVGFGSMGGTHLNKPVVGMAATPSGRGYWLVGSDGGIFTFGDGVFLGSTGSLHLNQPVVGMA